MTNEPLEPELGVPQGTEKADTFREFYSNHFRLGVTPFDLVLTFGHIVEKPGEGTTAIVEDMAVRLSPQTFKFITQALPGAMTLWESQFGQVQVQVKPPEEVLAAMKTLAEELKKKGAL
ncbi:MAG TPA: DUF3467 domain-containing protein [Xanthobacteraceae bacterium]|nr:DUF3467 domain-containing protein [Xanthobacteraceae bacterium]